MTPDPDPRIDVLLVAGAVLGAGTMLNNGRYHPLSLALVLSGFVLLCTQFTRAGVLPPPAALDRRIRMAYLIQATGLVASIGKHVVDFGNTGLLTIWVFVAALGTAVWLWGGWDALRRTPRSAMSLYICLGGVIIVSLATLVASPPAVIDVHVFQQVGAERLLGGENPYVLGYPDVYSVADSRRFYGPGLSIDGVLQFGFPYPPLSLLLVLPAQLLGGVQLAHLAAIAGTGLLLSRLGSDRTSRIGAVFLFSSTPTIFLIRQSWTEAFVVLLLALTVWTHSRGVGGGVALGLLGFVKQYCLLFVALYPLLTGGVRNIRLWGPRLIVAGAVVIVITVPFVVWDPAAFVHSVVELQFLQPFRTDALSISSFLAREIGWRPPLAGVLPFVAMAVAIVVSLWRAPRTPSGFALASAVTWLAAILVSKQAFANYYYTAIAAVYVAVAASTSPHESVVQDNGDYAELT